MKKVNAFIRGVFEYNLLSNFKTLPPKEMIINLTYWCNSRCVMCNIWKMKPKNELSFSEWELAMGDPIFRNIEALTISGGEATMHPKFLEIIELFIDSMPKLYSLGLITNGFMTDFIVQRVEKLAKICKEKSIHLSLSVSVDGAGKKHEDIRRIPDAFKKSTATLLAFKKLQNKYKDISVGSGSLILKQNLFDLEKTEEWFKNNKISLNFQIVGFHETFVNNLETKKNVDFASKQKNKLFEVLEKLAIRGSVRNLRSYYWKDLLHMYRDGKSRSTPCPFLKDQFVIDSFGDVYYCLSERPIGNFRTGKTVSSIYFDKDNLNFHQNMKKNSCPKCNSGCNVGYALAKDAKKYLWFRLTGRPWYGLKDAISSGFGFKA
jgi:MoaA/NifB/PqqE/SkfB family radical SAM enzyme